MDDSWWERLGAWASVPFVALTVLGILLPGLPPTIEDPVGDVQQFFVESRGEVLVGGYLVGLGLFFGLWFLGSLRSFLRRAEGGTGTTSAVAFGAGLVAVALALLATAVVNAAALRVAAADDPVAVLAMYDVDGLISALLWFPIAVLVAATSILAMRNGALPRWYGLAGPVLTLAFLTGATATYQDDGPLASHGVYGFAVLLLFLLWVLVTGALILGRVGKAGPGARP